MIDSFVPDGSGWTGNWSDKETKFLLQYFIENQNQFGPFQKFKNKRLMWENISRKLLNVKIERSPTQCEARYKNLKKKRDEIKTHNRTSGNNKRPFDYETEFMIIQSADDSVEPEVLCGIGQIATKSTDNKRKSQDFASTSDNCKKPKHVSILLEELYERKEEQKERRHKEKLEVLRELLSPP